MKNLIFTIFDSKAEAFTKPFFMATVGTAIRAFSDALQDEKSDFARHSEDYTLFQIGEFDELKGVLTSLPSPRSIVSAVEIKK